MMPANLQVESAAGGTKSRGGLSSRAGAWFRIEPPCLAWWEGLLMRAGCAGVAGLSVALTAGKVGRYDGQPEPNGIARWVDLSFLAEPAVTQAAVALFGLAMSFYILGAFLPVALTIMLVVEVGLATYCNSQGFIGHTTQVVSLVLLAQWLAALWRTVSRRDGWRDALLAREEAMNRAMDWSRQMLAATYVVSAVSKLIASNGQWIWQTPYYLLQMRKANDSHYFSTLEPVRVPFEWLGRLISEHPWLARVVIGSALPLELLAFLACFNRRLGAVVGLLLIGFHSSVGAMMNLGFAFNQYLLFVLFVNAPYWLWLAWKHLAPRPGR